ncbi:MAG: LCP family protein [Chloroflexota bacterium]|nr:LCP family protein [Chloroflexota bacterium]
MDQPPSRTLTPPSERARTWAVVLSFVWPGLGQLYLSRRRTAVLHALPPLAAFAFVILGASGGLLSFAWRLITPVAALTLLVFVLGIGILRVVSIVDARGWVPPAVGGTRSAVLAIVLSALVVACHGYGGYLALVLYRAGEEIYEPVPSVPPVAVSPAPSGSGPLPSARTPRPRPATPAPAPLLPSGRINVLLVGFDRGTNGPMNTDTMIFVSYDRDSEELIMISLPRDVAMVPMYDGGTWRRKINALYHYANTHPDEYPGGGMATLMREMEFLIGVPVPYYVSIDIPGFRHLLELVGGVTVDVERHICDPGYQFAPDRVGFCIEPGEQHLDPQMAEAYVRARHGTAGGDFGRARRQQQVILALRQKLDDPLLIGRLPEIVEATADFIRTNVPLESLPEVIDVVARSRGANERNIVLAPRRYARQIPPSEIGGLYALSLKMDAVAELSIELFGSLSRYAQSSPAP